MRVVEERGRWGIIFCVKRVQFEGNEVGFQAPIGPRRMWFFVCGAKQKSARGSRRLPVHFDDGEECVKDGRREREMCQRERNRERDR